MTIFRQYCLMPDCGIFRILLFVFLAAVSTLNVKSVLAFDLDNLELPMGSVAHWIARDVDQNGYPMQIQRFVSEQESTRVLDHFRAIWAANAVADAPAYIESTIGNWSTISTWIDAQHIVVQLRPSRQKGAVDNGFYPLVSRTEGYLSVLRMNRHNSSRFNNKWADPSVDNLELPVPEHSQVVSVSKSRDLMSRSAGNPVVATTVFLISSGDISSARDFYLRAMNENGWSVALDSQKSNLSSASQSLIFSRGGDSCEVALSTMHDGNVLVILNQLERTG